MGLVGLGLRLAGQAFSKAPIMTGATLLGTGLMGYDSATSIIDKKEEELAKQGTNADNKYDLNWGDRLLQNVGLFDSDKKLKEKTNKERDTKYGSKYRLLKNYGEPGSKFDEKWKVLDGKTGDNWAKAFADDIDQAESNRELERTQRRTSAETEALIERMTQQAKVPLNPVQQAQVDQLTNENNIARQTLALKETQLQQQERLEQARLNQQNNRDMFMIQERMFDRSHQRRRDTQNAMLGLGGALAAILSA